MPRGAGAARWAWLPLIVFFAALAQFANGDDGRVTGFFDPTSANDDLPDLETALAVGPVTNLPAPSRIQTTSRLEVDEATLARWTGLTPTDRAPPRG